jgi:hypothetical protein
VPRAGLRKTTEARSRSLEPEELAGEVGVAELRRVRAFEHGAAVLDGVGAGDEVHGAVDVLLDQAKSLVQRAFCCEVAA